MASSHLRMSLFLGSGKEGERLKDFINFQAMNDVRFKASEAEFVRYCISFAVQNDASLTQINNERLR